MPAPLTPQQFVAKWRSVTLKERSAVQEHFLDLCHLLGHDTPATGEPLRCNISRLSRAKEASKFRC